MTTSALIIVLFIFILAGLIVLRPFLDQERGVQRSGGGLYDSLLAEKERLYASIEDLDLNLELEKISLEEHAQGRDDLLHQAARVLKELDAHPYSSRSQKPRESLGADDKLEKMIAERRKKIQAAQNASCPTCGEPVAKGDQFCSHCGGKL